MHSALKQNNKDSSVNKTKTNIADNVRRLTASDSSSSRFDGMIKLMTMKGHQQLLGSTKPRQRLARPPISGTTAVPGYFRFDPFDGSWLFKGSRWIMLLYLSFEAKVTTILAGHGEVLLQFLVQYKRYWLRGNHSASFIVDSTIFSFEQIRKFLIFRRIIWDQCLTGVLRFNFTSDPFSG